MSIPNLYLTGKDIKRIRFLKKRMEITKETLQENRKKLSVFIFPEKTSAKRTLVHCAL